MLMGDYWWLSSPCSEYPSTLGLDLCLRRALGKVNTQVMLEYLPPWRYKPAYCESQLVTTSLGFLHDEPWKLCVQPIDAYHPPPSSLPHLQFFNALLIASPWILVPSWSLMMFGHSKIVLLNHLKPKPYWWIAKFREMDLLKNIFKILPLFTDFSFETPFQCGWASKSKAGPNRSNSISSDATAVKLSDLVGLKLWQQTFAETSQRGKLSPGFFLQNLHLRPFGSPGLKWICSNVFHGEQFQ